VKWKKLGQVFCSVNNFPWMISHATNPVAEHVEQSVYRVYFSCRDAENRSHIASLEFNIHSLEICAISENPVLRPGPIGGFDDSGVSMSCLAYKQDDALLYYVGWNLGVTVPWRNSIGLAIRKGSAGEFKKFSLAPLLDRDATDPFSLSYPFVMQEGPLYRMWYGSNLNWGKNPEDMAHVIKYAESDDGIHWSRTGIVALNLQGPHEYALARPFVCKENGMYKMWYSCRGSAYRIGYAESNDGLLWQRKDELAGIDVSSSGWDSEMIEYPFLFRNGENTYMLYNGNAYGRTGFGLALLET
jgi:hypothetical protein